MKKRNPLAVVLLSIITFGIYDLYWLVKTKAVLNRTTRHHTPTIFLLIIPPIILIAGYVLLFIPAFTSSSTNSTSSSTGSSSSNSSSGEAANSQGERRPAQYVHICDTTQGIEYVTQGTPNCLPGDTYQNDYSTAVPGTVYSSPCKTTSGPLRYVYISNDEGCPPGTSLLFYNSLGKDAVGISSHSLIALGLILGGGFLTFALGIFWFFRFSQAVNEYTAGKMSTAVSFLILWLIHLIGVALIQDAFNTTPDGPSGGANPHPASVMPPAAPSPTAATPAINPSIAPTPSATSAHPDVPKYPLHPPAGSGPPAPPSDSEPPALS